MKRNKKNGFTLVELLAVIAVLGLVLIIAVPKITNTMENSKKKTLVLTAKSIARSAEEIYLENETFGIDEEITCNSVSDYSSDDFSLCTIKFNKDGIASVTLIGKGTYKGLNICDGTKMEATATTESCTPVVVATTFEDDDWSTIVAAVKQAEKNGTEYPYEVGNTKTVEMDINGDNTAEEYTIRVSNKTKCSEVEVTSKTACGFVLEFADIITTYAMNGTDSASATNVGGWPATEMRAYLNDLDTESDDDGIIYNALPESLREGIIDTYVVSSHGSGDTTGELENDNFGSTDKLYLLSTYEVWGSNPGGYDTSAIDTITRQLDYYANYKGVDSTGAEYTGVTTSSPNRAGAIKNNSSGSASYWWLRSADSNRDYPFYYVSDYGAWGRNSAYTSYGVSPAFRLAN